MNYYVVIEDEKGVKDVYTEWIKLVNPILSPVPRPDDAVDNNYYIISGGGYPNYYNVIEDAIADVNFFTQYNRLVIAVDSEEMTYEQKCCELDDFLKGKQCKATIKYIIQHFCFETWALGNTLIVKSNPQDELLRKYIRHYNVQVSDPEYLVAPFDSSLNRSQFAEKYLRKLLNEKYSNLTYNKRNAQAVCHPKYYTQVANRCQQKGHIQSFMDFIQAFT